LTIPTWEGYPILNLSHAVSIVAYEWFGTLIDSGRVGLEEALPQTIQSKRLLDPELRRMLRESLTLISQSVPRHSSKQKGVESTLHRVLMRSIPDDYEAHRIIGILQDAALAMNHINQDEGLWELLRDQRRLERSSMSEECE
jgi:tRNA C32,U32 (ribose-2'-O)-methylase TrmJ